MSGLRYCDEVDRRIGKAAVLCGGDTIVDARVGCRLRDLFRARIGGDHALEALGERQRRLAVSRSTIPGEPEARAPAGEDLEESARIARSKT